MSRWYGSSWSTIFPRLISLSLCVFLPPIQAANHQLIMPRLICRLSRQSVRTAIPTPRNRLLPIHASLLPCSPPCRQSRTPHPRKEILTLIFVLAVKLDVVKTLATDALLMMVLMLVFTRTIVQIA